MRQMFAFPFTTGIILTAVSVVMAAPTHGAPNGLSAGKALYSSKPKAVSTGSSFANQQPRQLAAGNEMVVPSNRQAPLPPSVPRRIESFVEMPMTVADDLSFDHVGSSERILGETVISDRPLHEEAVIDSSPSLEESLERPLSGIEVPSKSVETAQIPPARTPSATAIGPWTSAKAQKVLANRPNHATQVAEPSESEGVDQFNARLAKIQLEKKNLDETLNLIQKIQSPSYKVKTLVDLAEYVSRDRNYKKEADRLYDLAVAGIDALASGKPVNVSTLKPLQSAPAVAPKIETSLTPSQSPEPAPKKALTLVDDEPVVAPKKRPTLTLLDEEDDAAATSSKPAMPKTETLTQPTEAKNEPTLAPPKGSRPGLSLTDEPAEGDKKVDELKKPEEAKKEEKKAEKEIGELPTLPAIPKKSEAEVKPEIKKDEPALPSLKKEESSKKEEDDSAADLKVPAQRSLVLSEEAENTEPILSSKPNAESNETLETIEKSSKDVELESPKPRRRSMPRKKIVLED